MKNSFFLLFTIICIVILWSYSSYSMGVNSIYIPSPHKVVISLFELIQTFRFWKDIASSFYRVFTGFLISFIVAYPLMILSLLNKSIKSTIFSIVEFLRYLPIPVFIPLTILWFGIGDFGKIFIIFLGTFSQMTPLFYDSAKILDNKFPSFRTSLKWSETRYVKKIIIPGSLPFILDNSRICFGWAWTYLIIAELLGANYGIGYAIIRAQRFLATDKIFAYIIVIGILGVLIDRLFIILKKKLFKWDL